ncbi:MAG: NAD(P)-binding protein [Devosia sp.]|nr:NAD(P)-binding protein [Devosia sp.]
MVDFANIYDVAIIGTGIGGSTLALVLARQGLRVIVFEGGVHPPLHHRGVDDPRNVGGDARAGRVI